MEPREKVECRIGEASNPGPEKPGIVGLATANITSWGAVQEALREAEHEELQVVVLQEHKLMGPEMDKQARRLKRWGWHVLLQEAKNTAGNRSRVCRAQVASASEHRL